MSRRTFSYVGPLMRQGFRRPLEPDDLWDTAERDNADRVARDFYATYGRTRPGGSGKTLSSKLFRALVVQHRRRFLTAGGLKLLHDLLMLAH